MYTGVQNKSLKSAACLTTTKNHQIHFHIYSINNILFYTGDFLQIIFTYFYIRILFQMTVTYFYIRIHKKMPQSTDKVF